MKIAIINQSASTGGWRYLYLLIKNMKEIKSDLDITIYVSFIKGVEEVEKLKEIDVKLKEIEYSVEVPKIFKEKNKFKAKIFNFIYNNIRKKIFNLQKIKTQIFKKNYWNDLKSFDCIFYSWPYDIECPLGLNIPIFFIPHDFIFTHFFGMHSIHSYTREWYIKQKKLLNVFIKNGNAIVSSPYIARELDRTFPEYKNHYKKDVDIVFLSSFNEYEELKQNEINEVLKKYDIKDDYILYANNWALHKNMQIVIGAYYLVKQKYPNIKLIITGYGTEGIYCQCNTPYYLDHIDENEKYDVKSLGILSNKEFSAVLQGSKMVINSSLCEAGSGNGVDAWNLGVPVVMSGIESFKEQIEFLGVKAELFDPRNSTDVARAILEILDNPEKAKKNAEISKEKIKEYSWEKIAKQYINIFERGIKNEKND